jgi:hypothetical protein
MRQILAIFILLDAAALAAACSRASGPEIPTASGSASASASAGSGLKAAQAACRDKLAGGRNPWSATAGKKPR